MSDNASSSAAPVRRSRMILPLLGCTVLIVASVFLYGPLLTIPAARSTAWPTLSLMASFAVLSIWLATRGRGWFGKTLAGVNAALPLLFAGAFFGLTGLPAAIPLSNQRAPEFTLPDQNGRPVALAETLAQGPVLLVFYRGHW